MINEREFVEVENMNGEVEIVEIFAKIKSKKDDKLYVLLTPDKSLKEYVNMAIGYVNNDNILELVEDYEERDYVYSLINEALTEEI